MEKDDEIKGNGNSLDFGARLYDPRVGRWLASDKLAAKRPDLTPYRFGLNNPISFINPDGNFEFDPAVLAKYPNVKPALMNLREELKKPENIDRLNDILKIGEYSSADQFFNLFDDNNKDIRITAHGELKLSSKGEITGPLAHTSNQGVAGETQKGKSTIAFAEAVLGALENADDDAKSQVSTFFNVIAEHELVHNGDNQDGIKGDAQMQLKVDDTGQIRIQDEAGEIYEGNAYGKVLGTSDFPKADKAIKNELQEKDPERQK
ncbi:MAG: hypothetical protein K9J17_16940 [Flavobacteriales bacterium]|nr:hypothetical protein [Flavobacteriales bacterium]